MRIRLTHNQAIAYRMAKLDILLGRDVALEDRSTYWLDAPLTRAQVRDAILALRDSAPRNKCIAKAYLLLARKFMECVA